MSNETGKIGWIDITVDEADGLRDFYADASAAACVEGGSKIVFEPRGLAGGRFCVIEDPSGATAALYQP